MLQLISRAGVPPIHWNSGVSQATGAAQALQQGGIHHLAAPCIPLSPSPLPCPMIIRGPPCPILRGAGQCRGAPRLLSSCQYLALPSTQTGPELWLGPGLMLAPVMLSETSLTSDSCIKVPWTLPNITPQRVSGCGRGTSSQGKTLCGLRYLRHDVLASATIPAHLLAIHSCPRFHGCRDTCWASTPQQHSQDLQHPYNGLAHNFDWWGRKKRKKNKTKRK